jgi:hypothetical protein
LLPPQVTNGGARVYALALLMPGRLFEAPAEKSARLLNRLRSSCSKILVYAYPDWSGRTLQAMVEHFGLELEASDATAALLKERQPDNPNA